MKVGEARGGTRLERENGRQGMTWREAEKESMDGMGNPTTEETRAPFPSPTNCSYRTSVLYDDSLNYGRSTMTRSNVSVVVKTSGSSGWVNDVADAE